MLRVETYLAVAGSGWPHRLVRLDRDDPGGYGRLIRALWAAGESVIVCEHDVVPTVAQLHALTVCPRAWCAHDYPPGIYGPGPMFGLARLSAALMASAPMAAERALLVGRWRNEEVPWWQVDSAVARDLTIRGARWHRHGPPVTHLHAGPSSGPPT